MEDLDLLGYSADLRHLVVGAGNGSRFRIAVDEDLLGTLGELLYVTDPDRLRHLLTALGSQTPPPEELPSPAAAGVLAVQAQARAEADAEADADAGVKVAPPIPSAGLTPGEIQRLLRAGREPGRVAREAGVDLDWVLRWYQPIAAEQQQVIRAVQSARQEREGAGPSRDVIGAAVRTSLRRRGIDPGGDDVTWVAARQDGRPWWNVTLRFREGGHPVRATWRYELGSGVVTPHNDAAYELGWTPPVPHPPPGRRADAEPPPPPSRSGAAWHPPSPPPPPADTGDAAPPPPDPRLVPPPPLRRPARLLRPRPPAPRQPAPRWRR